jgi:chromosome segregation ATPase
MSSDSVLVDSFREAWDAYAEWQKKFQQLYDTNTIALQNYETDLLHANNQINQLRQENNNIQEQMKNKDAENNNLIKSLSHTFESKQRIFDECEKQRFQREFSELILSQYREEIEEYKTKAKEKDQIIEDLVEVIATLESELTNFRTKPNETVEEGHINMTMNNAQGGLGQDGNVVPVAPAPGRPRRRRRRCGSSNAPNYVPN